MAPPALIKHSCGQPKKYLEQVNIAAVLDICFLLDKCNIFINKNADVQSAQYITSRQKEIVGLFKKDVKIVTIKNIPSNAQIFNSHFIDEIKNPGTDKVSKKNWLVI